MRASSQLYTHSHEKDETMRPQHATTADERDYIDADVHPQARRRKAIKTASVRRDRRAAKVTLRTHRRTADTRIEGI